MVQGLRLWAPNMGSVASVPSQELRAHMPLVHACSVSSVRKKKKKSLIILPPGGQGTKAGEIGFLA